MYQLPETTGVLVNKEGTRVAGTLPKMLEAYAALGGSKAGATIFLDQGIVMPPIYNGANRASRRNLNAVEMVLLSSYLDQKAA